MNWLLQVFLVIICLAFLLYVLLMVRRDKFLLKYSIIWVFLGMLGLVAAIFPEGVSRLSKLVGFETPVNFVFLICIVSLFASTLIFVAALSRQTLLIKKLIQEVSLLKADQDNTRSSEKLNDVPE